MNDKIGSTGEISIEEWKINLAKSYFDREKDSSKLMNKKIDSASLDDSVYHDHDDDDQEDEDDFCVVTKEDDGLRRRNKKTIEVDTDFVNAIYDNEMVKISVLNTNSLPVLKSPPSLKKLASSKMSSTHDDSGYEGLDSSCKGARSLGLDKIVEEKAKMEMTQAEGAIPQSGSELSKSYAEIFDRHVTDSFHNVEYVIVLVMICSIFYMVFMGDLEVDRAIEPSYGGKRAAIQYYYDKMNSNKYFF